MIFREIKVVKNETVQNRCIFTSFCPRIFFDIWPRSSFAIAVLGVTPARLGKSRLTGQIVGWTNLNRLSTHMQGLGASSWWTSGGTLLIYFWIVLSQFCMPTIRWCYFGVEQFTEIKTRNFFCKVEISWFWFELKSLHCEFIIFWIAVLDLKSILVLLFIEMAKFE